MQKPLIEPIWHPYWKWEEVKFNMWGSVENKKEFLQKAIEFTGDHKLYGKYMMRVVKEWKYSCEHNLSKDSQNKRAWVGHAAVALAMQCPEDIVRAAWWHLTDEQRELANKEADKAINYWEKQYVKKTTK
jgi:hypothetical protein